MRPSLLTVTSLLPVVAAALLAGGCDRQSNAPAQGNVAATEDDANMVSADEVAPSAAPAASATAREVDRSHKSEPAPAYAFADTAGKLTTLAAFRGKPTLVNLWATWCAPCVKELPTLDALAVREAGKLTVVALSQDMKPDKVAPFVASKGFKALATYTDGKMAWVPAISATLPATILYGSDGREVWRMIGDYDWAGAEAAKLIAEAK